jgi:hypothetical protein
MLGVATVGTLAHEQLSYLVRQPHSVFHTQYPYFATLRVTNLQANDRVSIHRIGEDGEPFGDALWDTTRMAMRTDSRGILIKPDDRIDIPIRVLRPGDENVMVRSSGLVATPYDEIGLARVKREGESTPYMPDAGEWKTTTRSSSYWVSLEDDAELDLSGTYDANPTFFPL